MIQNTQEQYIFTHGAILEVLTCVNTEINSADFQTAPNDFTAELQTQFEALYTKVILQNNATYACTFRY